MKLFKLLIVDDEADILEFLSYNFSKKGFDVSVALNGTEGIKKAVLCKPDLIISDILMPGIDGIEMCKELRKHARFQSVPVIFLTAVHDDYQVMYAMLTGDQYLQKPVKFDFLLGLVNEMLDESRRVRTSGFTIN